MTQIIMIHGITVVAYIVAPWMQTEWRRYCVLRGAVIAYIATPLSHVSLYRQCMFRGSVLAYDVA